jgi:hypothetical protein
MKHIKKFNENYESMEELRKYSSFGDSTRAIADSFNKVKQELDLLNKRLGWTAGKSEELDEFGSEVSQMKINFDELLSKFTDFDNEFFGR